MPLRMPPPSHHFAMTRAASSCFGGRYIGVARGVLVPTGAVGFSKVPRLTTFTNHSSQHVLMVGNGFKVIGVCADAISAQMVKFKTCWKFAVQCFPDPSMREGLLSRQWLNYNGIPVMVGCSTPPPASIHHYRFQPEFLPSRNADYPSCSFVHRLHLTETRQNCRGAQWSF